MDSINLSVSPTELDILKVLWEHGPGTVREINRALEARGRQWAYTTVQTLLRRLEGKGYVAVDTGGYAHVFHAAKSREDLLSQGIKDLAEQFCEGMAAPLLLSLVQSHQFTAEEIARFRTLLDELEEEPGNARDRSRGKGSPKKRKKKQ